VAIEQGLIEAVRILDADGVAVEHPWDPNTWYLVRDDQPYLDFLTRGPKAQAVKSESEHIDVKIKDLPDLSEPGAQWQRWDFETEVARRRRLGEISLALKVPKNCVLRCYIIPTLLLSFRDVVVMVEEIEEELGIGAAWDMLAGRRDRSWSRTAEGARSNVPAELIKHVEEELQAARWIRRAPFEELAAPSPRDSLLAENALVSHWATRRYAQVRDLAKVVSHALTAQESRSRRGNPATRQTNIDNEVERLRQFVVRLTGLKSELTHLVTDAELATPIYPSPLFQRDHRLRRLLRVFAPPSAQALSETQSAQSHYPPMFLNDLWELWGAVWLARQLRRLGFSGLSSIERVEAVHRCSWRLVKGAIKVDLDFEAEPALVDYDRLPPVYARTVSTMEWVARNQDLDEERPYFGLEARCSPDYLIRVTTPSRKALMVGDACLASPKHHGKKHDKSDSKPHTVEKYRRTIGWSAEGEMISCHPFGGFALLPPPIEEWSSFEGLPAASDCTILCPQPGGDSDADHRLELMLARMAPELESCSGSSK
jgi:hypothetical protein